MQEWARAGLGRRQGAGKAYRQRQSLTGGAHFRSGRHALSVPLPRTWCVYARITEAQHTDITDPETPPEPVNFPATLPLGLSVPPGIETCGLSR
jgi:hypothetical protein